MPAHAPVPVACGVLPPGPAFRCPPAPSSPRSLVCARAGPGRVDREAAQDGGEARDAVQLQLALRRRALDGLRPHLRQRRRHEEVRAEVPPQARRHRRRQEEALAEAVEGPEEEGAWAVGARARARASATNERRARERATGCWRSRLSRSHFALPPFRSSAPGAPGSARRRARPRRPPPRKRALRCAPRRCALSQKRIPARALYAIREKASPDKALRFSFRRAVRAQHGLAFGAVSKDGQ